MGRGDKKSKKGKIWKGSYGNSRSKAAIKARIKRAASAKPAGVAAETESGGKTKAKRTVKKKETAE
jgi:30S ribosomal protein S31